MKNRLLLLLLVCLAAAQVQAQNQGFARTKEKFLKDYFKLFPEQALDAGNHDYDSLVTVFDPRTMAFIRSTTTAYKSVLAQVKPATLTPLEQMELAVMQGEVAQLRFFVDTLQSWRWNPSMYNATRKFSVVLSNTGQPLPVRMKNILAGLRQVPAYYAAAKANVRNPTREHTQLAVLQHMGALDIFNKEIIDSGNKAKLGFREMELLTKRCKAAADAANGYLTFLQGLKPAKWRSFALGEELYRRKFHHDLGLPIGVDEAYKLAQARKAEMHRRMYALASGSLWGKYFAQEPMPKDTLLAIRQLVDKISLNHTTRDSFQLAIERQIPELEAFVRQTNLVEMDPTKPLQVRREPEYMKGVAGASISSPGFYEPGGATYYNVGTLAGYTPDDAESFLREYNRFTLQILNIHEAVPGHYVQLIHSNKAPSPILAIFGNGAMVEGWAVYSEQAMLEAGYGKGVPEIEFMYAKWHLRSVCNTILDISVHTRDMDSTAAMQLLTQQAFQQTEEARGKWRRVRLSQVQLCSYFTGYSQIIACRERIRAQQGSRFTVRAFHDKLLSFGSAPLKYLVPAVEKGMK